MKNKLLFSGLLLTVLGLAIILCILVGVFITKSGAPQLQTYLDPTGRFQFEHPSTWAIEVKPQNVRVYERSEFTPEAYEGVFNEIEVGQLDPAAGSDANGCLDPQNQNFQIPITVGDEIFYGTDWWGVLGGFAKYVCLRDGLVISMTAQDEASQRVLERALSSFRFHASQDFQQKSEEYPKESDPVQLPSTGTQVDEEFGVSFTYPPALDIFMIESVGSSSTHRWREYMIRGDGNDVSIFLGARATDGRCMGFDYLNAEQALNISGKDTTMHLWYAESPEGSYYCASARFGSLFFSENRYDNITMGAAARNIDAALKLYREVADSIRVQP